MIFQSDISMVWFLYVRWAVWDIAVTCVSGKDVRGANDGIDMASRATWSLTYYLLG